MVRRPARVGLPVVRPPGSPTPCWKCPKVPPGEPACPESAVEMTDQNWRAFRHYEECRAVGAFPDDPIVRRNAALIRRVYDAWEQDPVFRLLGVLGQAAVKG